MVLWDHQEVSRKACWPQSVLEGSLDLLAVYNWANIPTHKPQKRSTSMVNDPSYQCLPSLVNARLSTLIMPTTPLKRPSQNKLLCPMNRKVVFKSGMLQLKARGSLM